MTFDNLCQSCAMPMASDEDRGKNADGTINMDYCKYCYPNGSFNNENETMAEMVTTCIPFLVQYDGKTEVEARKLLEDTLPHLKRWK